KELKKGTERKQVILELLLEKPAMTQTQLMEKLELTRKQIQTDIKELRNEGILECKGSNRNGYWIIKSMD
ncbi:HTH domain-containing protein, partial [Merdimonas faecis]